MQEEPLQEDQEEQVQELVQVDQEDQEELELELVQVDQEVRQPSRLSELCS